MEQTTTTDWQLLARNEHKLRKQLVIKAKHLLNKTTGYAKYLEQQNYELEEKLTTRTDKLQQAISIIKSLQSLATKQKEEIVRLDANNINLSRQISQQTDLLRAEIIYQDQIKQELDATKQELHDALSISQKTVAENNWQEFFVYKPIALNT